MSLLTIVQGAADLIGLPIYNQVVGNAEADVRQLFANLKIGSNTLVKTTNGSGGSWSALERIYEFQSAADQTEYILPEDFDRLIVGTAWQKDKYWQMRGSRTPQQWQRVRNRQSSTPYNQFRLLRTQNGQGSLQDVRRFTLEPAPGENITLVYEYVSTWPWVSEDGSTFKKVPDNDNDRSVLGDDIHILDTVWRFKKGNGLSYSADLAEFEAIRDAMLVQDEASEAISVGYDRRFGANKDESDVEWGYIW